MYLSPWAHSVCAQLPNIFWDNQQTANLVNQNFLLSSFQFNHHLFSLLLQTQLSLFFWLWTFLPLASIEYVEQALAIIWLNYCLYIFLGLQSYGHTNSFDVNGERKTGLFADGCQLVYPFTLLFFLSWPQSCLLFPLGPLWTHVFPASLCHACIVLRVNKTQAGPMFSHNLDVLKFNFFSLCNCTYLLHESLFPLLV